MTIIEREIFRKVASSEKKEIIKALISSKKGEIILKGSSDDIFYLKGYQVLEGGLLEVQNVHPKETHPANEPAIVNIVYDNHRYFFQTTVVTSGARIILDTNEDFYILQRRKSPRLEIPDSYHGLMNIVQYKERPVFYDGRIIDFGSGGVRLAYDRAVPYFKTGEKFTAFLHISTKTPIKLNCEVRHTMSTGPSPQIPQVFGVRFEPSSSINENRLLVIFMDLQRDLFVKFGRKA